MIILFFIYFLFAISFNGWGSFTFYLLGVKSKFNLISQNIFVGISTVLLITQGVHLFLPINWVISAIVIIVGIVFSCIFSIRENNKQFFAIITQVKSHPYIYLGIVILIFGFATRMMEPIGHGDAGLYHVPTISWLNQHSIVPGLGNLHFRLAFNQSYFHFVALLNIFPYWDHGYASANFIIFIWTLIFTYQFINSQNKDKTFIKVILALIFIGILQDSISTAPDFTICLYEFNIFLILFKIYINNNDKREQNLQDIVYLLILATTCITIKISSIVYCIACVLLAIIHEYEFIKNNYKNLFYTLFLCFLILFISMLTGYILSGYPLYPSSITLGLNPEWKIPLNNVKQEQDWIFSWARLPDALPKDVLGNWNWFTPWLENLSSKVWLPLSLGGVIIFICLCFSGLKRNYLNQQKSLYLLYAPLIAALVFWFFTAPDVRFIGAIPGLLIFLSVFIFYKSIDLKKIYSSNFSKLIIIILSVLLLVFALMYLFRFGTGLGVMQRLHLGVIIVAFSEVGINQNLIKIILPSILLFYTLSITPKGITQERALKASTFLISSIVITMLINYMNFKWSIKDNWASVPIIESVEQQTNSGLKLRIPVKDDRCWSSNLPCTPYFNSGLQNGEVLFSDFYKFKNGFWVNNEK